MPRPIIEVKGLSKKYRISHQGGYLALRDILASCLKKPFEVLKHRREKLPSREDIWALKDVSFDIKQGEVVGLIGRNGAGKTTLLKILSKITYPAEGEVYLWGRVGSLLEVGTGFHAELTGRENIYFNGAILGMKKKEIDRKFDEIVEFSGVEKFLDTPVKRFSSGMQVRLAFSVAAHLEPEILLVDEVLAVGDAQFQKKCLGKMKDISTGGRTILFVSHNMSAIRSLCSRTIMLENGRLAMDADTETVVSRYLDQNLKIGALISGKELESKLEGKINKLNPSIRFKEVAFFNAQDLPASTFNSGETIKIRITYECVTVVNNLNILIHIVDEESKVVFESRNTDNEDEANFYHRDPGVYVSTCVIPLNSLKETRLFVSVYLEYPKVEHLILDRILGFNIIFQGQNEISVGLKDSSTRPSIKWDTEFIGTKKQGEDL